MTDHAKKVIDFIQTYCIISKHPFNGKPMALMPWQLDLINDLYGTVDANGIRKYRRAVCFIPKKNGKSGLCSALALYHLLEYPGSECYVIAPTIKQAGCIFDEAMAFAETHPLLKQRLHTKPTQKIILDKGKRSKLQIITASPEVSGFNANVVIWDELAELGAHARLIWDKLANATAARVNSLQMVISTAQFNISHLGKEQFDLAVRVKENPDIDPTLYPCVYAADPEKWKDREEWKRVNPGIGHCLRMEEMEDDFRRLEASPQAETAFKTLRLNIWESTHASFIKNTVWEACQEDYTEEEFYGAKVWFGIDMARKFDLASYVLIAERNGLTYIFPRFFLPADNIRAKSEDDKFPYEFHAKNPKNHLYATPGDVISPSFVRQKLIEDSKRFRFDLGAFDPHGFEESRQLLEAEGLQMVEATQSPRVITDPTLLLHSLAGSRRIRHNSNPIFNWCLGNCITREYANGNQIMLDKARSRARIDPVAALINALYARQVASANSPLITSKSLLVW